MIRIVPIIIHLEEKLIKTKTGELIKTVEMIITVQDKIVASNIQKEDKLIKIDQLIKTVEMIIIVQNIIVASHIQKEDELIKIITEN